MALTATVTPQVKQKISSVLRNPTQVLASVNKPNISLSVMKLRPLQKGTYKVPKIPLDLIETQLIFIVLLFTGSVVGDQYERKFTHLAEHVHIHIEAQRAIIYLVAAKHVPRLAIALRQREVLKTMAKI